ncbi:MAG: IS481 family transposase [Cyanobacteriota/Melainabacteria group bacterium]
MPPEALLNLRARLEQLTPRSPERKLIIEKTAELYGVSRSTLYRELNNERRTKGARRSDYGSSRKVSKGELDRYCEVVAALKLRTENKKGHHISTEKAIEIIVHHGVSTPDGWVKAAPGLLDKSLINRRMRALGYDRKRLGIEPPCVRFQAEWSNQCWQFDMSTSDLKQVEEPAWIEPGRGKPTLTLFSVVDDRSGVNYTEYWSVYGEEVETALRFLYNAMAPKKLDDFMFQGVPEMIYLDNGPVAKSAVFQRVMFCLGIKVKTHEPRKDDKIGERTTSRSKGKVERPFLTVKCAHEALYHLGHVPKTEAEANEYLLRYVYLYNKQDHRQENHSRIQDWVSKLPDGGFTAVCSWEKFRSFAREPEQKTVARDCTISMDGGVKYEVSPELVGEKVVVWWGLFDNELFVEHGEVKYGPYKPSGGPIPLHTFRRHKKTRREKTAERIEDLSKKLAVPRSVLTGKPEDSSIVSLVQQTAVPSTPFRDRFEYETPDFDNKSVAKLAIAKYLGRAIADLPDEARQFIAELVDRTLNKKEVLDSTKTYFAKARRKDDRHAR